MSQPRAMTSWHWSLTWLYEHSVTLIFLRKIYKHIYKHRRVLFLWIVYPFYSKINFLYKINWNFPKYPWEFWYIKILEIINSVFTIIAIYNWWFFLHPSENWGFRANCHSKIWRDRHIHRDTATAICLPGTKVAWANK